MLSSADHETRRWSERRWLVWYAVLVVFALATAALTTNALPLGAVLAVIWLVQWVRIAASADRRKAEERAVRPRAVKILPPRKVE